MFQYLGLVVRNLSTYLRVLLLTTAALCPIALTYANDSRARLAEEYSVKGIYLLNFAKFTTWTLPLERRARGIFRICTWKRDPFLTLHTIIDRKQVNSQKVEISTASTHQEIHDCDILFVKSEFAADTITLYPIVQSQHILLVTEGVPKGMINFSEPTQGRIGFECDLTLSERAAIKFSSQLLSLAMTVNGENEK